MNQIFEIIIFPDDSSYAIDFFNYSFSNILLISRLISKHLNYLEIEIT